ncbi:MAG: hypothetical protein V4653_06545 [Pseudomonadota bacterium]
MPDFDGGHYFLTALIPVRTDPCQDPRSTESITSHTHALREVLASLPTALQSPATERIGVNSPFARCGRTHFARLAVLDDVAFNGRAQRDPIWATLRSALKRPYPPTDTVDNLPCPYLIVVADFDADDGEPETMEAWARDLFGMMEPEWRAILEHCHGYERVTGAAGFARLLRTCQVETTMPFNDYWSVAPPFKPLDLLRTLAPALVGLVMLLLGGLLWIFNGAPFWRYLTQIGIVVLPAGLVWAWWVVMREGRKPFPTAPRSDLQSVLKALYLQQQFTRFAITSQGMGPAALHASFGSFLATHQPGNPVLPTQPRGVVKS